MLPKLVIDYIDEALVLLSVIPGPLVKEVHRYLGSDRINERGVARGFLTLVATQTFSDVLKTALGYRVIVRTIFICKDKDIAPALLIASWVDARNSITEASVEYGFDLLL